jgi:hypothetical protein
MSQLHGKKSSNPILKGLIYEYGNINKVQKCQKKNVFDWLYLTKILLIRKILWNNK